MPTCSSQPKVTRLNNGKPIISPTSNWWESGATFNPAVVYVERSPKNDPIIRKLIGSGSLDETRIKDGIVVVHYRARPSQETDPKRPFSRSFSGVAVFTPELHPIYRHNNPVILPGEDENLYDYVSVEDGRLHCFGGIYYYLYCGVGMADNPRPKWPVKTRICLAKSDDLLTWQKLGPVPGNVNTEESSNKNGVLFPEKIDGHYFMLHRPCFDDNYSKYAIALAMSSSIEGPWRDLGIIKRATQNAELAKHIWVGAGSVPISVGDKKFIVIYHKGHVLNSGSKWYDLHADLFNFNNFDPCKPANIIERCLRQLIIPETPYECESTSREGISNVVFTCGSYEYNGDIYILYGGADCCTLAAKVNKKELTDCLLGSQEHKESEDLRIETAPSPVRSPSGYVCGE
jgi:beta-1,2-mannobiose phosphorylase / 1,2-beta-oligomannan phosphorylase